MPQRLLTPITLLVTDGTTTEATTPAGADFARVERLAATAARAGVTIFQIREKSLRPRVLCELAGRAARVLRGTGTRLVVNDRADVAYAAGADGVHLTSSSLDAATVRRTFGANFLVGVSTHSHAEARAARDAGADYALLGPVFDTPSKRAYGPPLGLEKFGEAARALPPFPVVAVGGINLENVGEVFRTGASGVAAISLFGDAGNLDTNVRAVMEAYEQAGKGSAVERD